MSDTLTPLRLAIVFLGLLLPTLALIPLGSLWLWQHGFLIHWALATLGCTLLAYRFERMTLGPKVSPLPSSPSQPVNAEMQVTTLRIDDDPLRKKAAAAVEKLANTTSTEAIASWNDLLNSGLKTVETVAKVYHPDRADPML
ncbi:MAG: GTP-binding protein HSR1, partial [Hyphomicrobium denitrificans]|nr:GTP-binding protein HSR1 [Hyphomicrobium denitrificans]